ncbi:MAG TPA: hypothetical protein VJX93_04255 [Candidatus Methanomethylophilaceae archaeon]|nr:hypothetical protein [Candidatus Methanomethylophilaceae archaeon]
MPVNKIANDSVAEQMMTPERALFRGRAVGSSYNNVTVGMDLSRSGRMIRDAFVSGLLSVGARVYDASYAPAPAIAMVANRSDCCAIAGEPDVYGSFSDILLRNPDGSLFDHEQIRSLEKYSKNAALPNYLSIDKIHRVDGVVRRYIERVADACGDIDCPVVVDCGCGSASLAAPQALAAAGADVMSVNSHLDRNYSPRSSDIGPSEAKDVQAATSSMPGSIGILLNGDGTRVALIDEEARYVSGSDMLALLVKHMQPKKLVVPIDMSSAVDAAFWGEDGLTAGRSIIRCEPDSISLAEVMKEQQADFGALSNGTVIMPGMTRCPDGIYAGCMLAKIAGTDSLRRILDEMPSYVTDETRIQSKGSVEALSRKISNEIEDLDYKNAVHAGGWRVDMDGGWFLVERPDHEGVINIKIEAGDKAYAVGLLEIAKEIVNKGLRSQ